MAHPKNQKISLDFEAYPKQAAFIHDPAQESAFIGGIGSGKALALNTPLPTPTGWTTMEQAKVGDQLFDEQGQICSVIFETPIMSGHKCYQLTFSDGAKITADAEHLWETWTWPARKAHSRAKNPILNPSLVSTEAIKITLKHNNKETNHSIPLTSPVECPEKALPIDPYVLGVWLGDGTKSSAHFTITEEKVLEQIRQAGYNIDQVIQPEGKAACYCIGKKEGQRNPLNGRMISNGSLTSLLKENNLIGNKHIPILYLRASVQQRTRLLQGLMDTDGCIGISGHCEFCNTNKKLSEDVLELILSLGMRANLVESSAKLYGRYISPKYRIFFTPRIPVFTLDYKLVRMPKKFRKWSDHRYITNVEEVPSVPVKCIQVDSPSHLYLAGDHFIPTHNTYAGALKALIINSQNKGVWGIVTAPQLRLLKAATIPTYDKIFPPEMILKRRESPHFEWDLINGNKILFWSTEKPHTIAGLEIGWAHMDEASLSPYESYLNIKKRMRQRDKSGVPYNYQLFMTTTPRQLNWLYNEINRSDTKIKMFSATTFDNIYLENREEYVKSLGIDGKAYEQEVEGKFVYMSGECLFSVELINSILRYDVIAPIRYEEESQLAIWKEPVVGGHYVAAADCSDEGGQGVNVLIIMDAQTGEEVAELYADIPAAEFADKCFTVLSKWKYPLFAPERNGTVGGIVVQKLVDLGYPNLYHDNLGKPGWMTTSRSVWPRVNRYEMLMHYEEALRLRQTITHSSEMVGEMSTFVREDQKVSSTYRARKGYKDDRIMARAICWQIREEALKGRGRRYMSIQRLYRV